MPGAAPLPNFQYGYLDLVETWIAFKFTCIYIYIYIYIYTYIGLWTLDISVSTFAKLQR